MISVVMYDRILRTMNKKFMEIILQSLHFELGLLARVRVRARATRVSVAVAIV